MAYTSSCSQLTRLSVSGFDLVGAGRLVASSSLQQLELCCSLVAADADAPAAAGLWEEVLTGSPYVHKPRVGVHQQGIHSNECTEPPINTHASITPWC